MSFVDLMGFGPRGWGLALLTAAGMTLAVAACGFLAGAVFGALAAAAKVAGGLVSRGLAALYTTVLRGVPALLVSYLFYFGGSSVLSALGSVSGAYPAEVYRGAYLALPRGELEAARAVGMGRALMVRRVVVPQVLRYALPGLGNVWQLLLKESALVSVVGLVELLRQSQIGAGSTRQPFDFYAAAGLLYLVITTVSTWGFSRAEARSRRGLA